MSIFNLHRSVLTNYQNFVRSYFTISDERVRRLVEQKIFKENAFWPEPLLQLSPSYARSVSVDELAARKTITTETAAMFRTASGSPFYLYQHQLEALERSSPFRSRSTPAIHRNQTVNACASNHRKLCSPTTP
jgi:ATP-dependent helicase YprA (DUF1998 family)